MLFIDIILVSKASIKKSWLETPPLELFLYVLNNVLEL